MNSVGDRAMSVKPQLYRLTDQLDLLRERNQIRSSNRHGGRTPNKPY